MPLRPAGPLDSEEFSREAPMRWYNRSSFRGCRCTRIRSLFVYFGPSELVDFFGCATAAAHTRVRVWTFQPLMTAGLLREASDWDSFRLHPRRLDDCVILSPTCKRTLVAASSLRHRTGRGLTFKETERRATKKNYFGLPLRRSMHLPLGVIMGVRYRRMHAHSVKTVS
jgi:hypothetical protein